MLEILVSSIYNNFKNICKYYDAFIKKLQIFMEVVLLLGAAYIISAKEAHRNV